MEWSGLMLMWTTTLGVLDKCPEEFDTMDDFVQALVKKVFIAPITSYALEIKKEENENN